MRFYYYVQKKKKSLENTRSADQNEYRHHMIT